jgi:integrase
MYTVYDAETNRTDRKTKGFATEAEAEEYRRAVTASIDARTYKEPVKITVAEWLDEWISTYCCDLKQHTIAQYTSSINNHIKPAIGAIKLELLTSHDVQKMINGCSMVDDKDKTVSSKSIKNVYGILHSAMTRAIYARKIKENPCIGVKLPKIVKKEMEILTGSDLLSFLEAIKGHQYEYLYTFGVYTGLREGELMGLTWDDIDFNEGKVRVARQLAKEKKKGGGYFLDSVKNDKINYLVPPEPAMEALHKQLMKQKRERLKAGCVWDNKWNLVFTNDKGGHLVHVTVWANYKRIVTALGRPNLRVHDLRHSCATLEIQSGVDLTTVSRNRNHASAGFTADVYGHVSLDMKRMAADKVNSFIDTHLKIVQ